MLEFKHNDCRVQGEVVPEELLGNYRECSPDDSDGQIQCALADDGYVFIRNAIDVADAEAARNEVFGRLVEVGEIAEPAGHGIFTGHSQRTDVGDLGHFWRSVSQGPQLRKVSHGEQITQLVSRVLGEQAKPHDYIFLRPGVPGRSTNLHYDKPFFARGSNRIHTVWTAINDIPVRLGPLMVLEGSQHFTDLYSPAEQVDYTSNSSPQVQYTDSPIELARSRGTRLLTADFKAGDVIIFTMQLMHGTLDNHSDSRETRLSCDVRFQPAADPFDERYMGDNPAGTTGAGYGELNGAKPLTENWHTR